MKIRITVLTFGALLLALCAPRLPLPALRFPQVVAKSFMDSNKIELGRKSMANANNCRKTLKS